MSRAGLRPGTNGASSVAASGCDTHRPESTANYPLSRRKLRDHHTVLAPPRFRLAFLVCFTPCKRKPWRLPRHVYRGPPLCRPHGLRTLPARHLDARGPPGCTEKGILALACSFTCWRRVAPAGGIIALEGRERSDAPAGQ